MKRRAYVVVALVILVSLAGASSLGARVVDPRTWPESATVRPFTPIRFSISADAKSYALDVYPVDLVTFRALSENPYSGSDDFDSQAVRHADGPTARGNWARTDVTVGGLPIGLYAVRVQAGDWNTLVTLDVTTFGVMSAQTPSGFTYLASDLANFRRRDDISYSRLSGTGLVRDADGEVELAGESGNVAIARSSDGSIVIARGGLRQMYGLPHWFAQTDRPLYHPGDTVSYRLIERSGDPGGFIVPSGDRQVSITDQSGTIIGHQSVTFSSYGTVNGSFSLPADASLGRYRITDGIASADAIVAAYEKPEYTITVAPVSTSVIGGEQALIDVDARYFSGGPAAGMHLHYRVTRVDRYHFWNMRGIPEDGPIRRLSSPSTTPEAEGDAIADAHGHARVAIPTQASDVDRDLQIDVEARDASGKTVTAGAPLKITSASFELWLQSDSSFARTGNDAILTVRSATVDGTPRPHVAVALEFDHDSADGSGRSPSLTPLATVHLTTDADGTARYVWKPVTNGPVIVRATATDERGRIATSRQSIWAAAESYGAPYVFDSASVSPEEPSTGPDEPARFLVTSPERDVDALVSVWYGVRTDTFVQHLSSTADVLTLRPPPGSATYTVTVSIPSKAGIMVASTDATISPLPHALVIKCTPDRKRYHPGDEAHFSLDVRDEDGRPAIAEIGIGIIDDALLEVAPTRHPRPFAAFYEPGWGPLNATWSGLDSKIPIAARPRIVTLARIGTRNAGERFQPAQMQDGIEALTPHPPSPDALRSDVRDTAYWSPSVVTGANGRATLSFRWPDNLTSYTAAGVGVTQSTDIGTCASSTMVTKDFLIR